MEKSSEKRFSDRVENYVKYRPRYPQSMMDWFKDSEEGLDLQKEDVMADIGSGTGISAELFLRNGNKVYGVEPNKEMREEAEKLLGEYENFVSIDGTAEKTTLPDNSMDLIIAGQAFHWFDVMKAREEFKRILKDVNGTVALIWNTRPDTPGLMRDYDNLLAEYGTDYKEVRHSDAIADKDIAPFFGGSPQGAGGYELNVFENFQMLDFDGFKGRVFSCSYMPNEDEASAELMEAMRKIFDEYQKDGKVKMDYETKVYHGKLKD